MSLRGTTLDISAWRAYEAVEEAWIRDRHALVLEQCPECAAPAAIDLELKLVELQRRAFQFLYVSKNSPRQLRGGMWQLSWIPLSGRDTGRMVTESPQYRECEEKIRRLAAALRSEARYELFRSAQTRLWKTPEYRAIHRRYSGRLYELNRIYGGTLNGSP